MKVNTGQKRERERGKKKHQFNFNYITHLVGHVDALSV
jgi:hypothetical protein